MLMSSVNTCLAKHKFNPKIERKSYVVGTEAENYCRTHDCWNFSEIDVPRQLEYIYVYPKNIDKMIKENPEFKDEIEERLFNFLIYWDENEKLYTTFGPWFRKNYNNYIECFPDKEICDDHNEIVNNFHHILKCAPYQYYCENEETDINKTIEDIKKYDTNNKEPLDKRILELINIIQSGRKLKYDAISVKSCKDLWGYDFILGSTVYSMKQLPLSEQECNKIVKKILKKTGKLY
jgi:hypothetical protein